MAGFEAALRGGAVVLYVLVGALLLRDARRTPAGLYGGLLAFGVAAFVVRSSYGLVTQDAPWLLPFQLVSLGNNALFWIFAAACFDDEFAASWRHLAAWVGTVALGLWCVTGRQELVCLAFEGGGLVFIALAMSRALVGNAGDLLEGRRRFRVVLVVAAALYAAVVIVSNMVRQLHAPPLLLATMNAAGLLALVAYVAFSRLGFLERPQAVPLTAAPGGALPSDPSPADPGRPAAMDAEEAALLARLAALMEEGKAYREDGLSIAVLAAKLAIPEYRLRRLINQRLGHRNFSTFVNGYRLAEVMAALADPAQAEVPILTIALDAGFQSIGPFNRAFKAATGVTPTEYRRHKLGRAGDEGAKP